MLTAVHRPSKFSEVRGQELAKKILTAVVRSPEDSPRSLILAGGRGLGKCVSGDTWVRTPHGLRPIKELVGDCKEDTFEECPTKVSVFSNDDKVLKYYAGVKSGYRVVFEDERTIEVSESERFLCWDGKVLDYYPVEDISGKEVVVDCTVISDPSDLAETFSQTPERSAGYRFGLQAVLHRTAAIHMGKGIGSISKYSMGPYDIPPAIVEANLNKQRDFVRGLLEYFYLEVYCAGSRSRDCFCISDYRDYFSDTVWNFMITVLYLSGVRLCDPFSGHRGQYQFLPVVEFISGFLKLTKEEDMNWDLLAVKSVEKLPNPLPLYDLSNPTAHCFVANGLVVHNTTSSRIFAKAVNCETHSGDCCNSCSPCSSIRGGSSPLYMELDSAIVGNVDVMREMRDSFSYTLAKGYRVIVLDECQLCSKASQSALLKVLEEAPKGVFFVLSTTNPEQLLPTIISRSLVVPYNPLTPDELKAHLVDLSKKESISVSETTLSYAARRVKGHVRDGVQQLELIKLVGESDYLKTIELLDEELDTLLKLYREGKKEEAKKLVSKLVLNPVLYLEQDFEVFARKLADRVFIEGKGQSGEKEIVMFWLKNHRFVKSTSDWYLFLTALSSLFEAPKQSATVNRFIRT